MAVVKGQRITYGYNVAGSGVATNPQNEKLDISSYLDVLSPSDTPLLRAIGRDSLRKPCVQVKHEWLEDELRGMTTVTSGLNNTTDPVSVTLTTAAHTAYFRGTGGTGSPADYTLAGSVNAGDIVRLWDANGEELAIVTNVTATVVDLDRSQLGTTPVSHTTSCNMTIVGTFQPQGLSTVGLARTTTYANQFNYTQIFEDAFYQSATQAATDKWTESGDRAYQWAAIIKVMGIQMERALIYGRRQQPTTTVGAQTGPAGAMQGIRPYISTNVYNKSGALLTLPMLEDALQAIWEQGGEARLAVMNATQKRRVNTFLDAYRQVGYDSTTVGTRVERYDTDFGTLDVLLDRHMPTDEVLILDPARIGFGPMTGRALHTDQAPIQSTEAKVWEIVGEYTAEVRQEKAHARIYGLATTGIL